MAASSSSSSKSTSRQGWTYDVFLSFAGEDTRKGFVGHLFTALSDKGIYTFRDDIQLRMGDAIADGLLNSISESRIAVVIFSANYAGSSWCLDELVSIMDCRSNKGQMVIPVFYNVDPSDVRKQKGVFEIAFEKHEDEARDKKACRKGKRLGENDLGKVKRWREALFEAASISGCHLSVTANGHESDCIMKIVQEISSKCHRNSSAAKNLVGIIPRVREIESLLDTMSNDVRIIGIWGMGGAGKTTLAWAVYNETSYQFEGRCYVANIREVSRTSGLHFLQGKVLSELLSERNMNVTSELEGIELMATRLRHKKILLVLDDVDNDGQLDALAGSREWFGMGSRIIITTRDKHCLKLSNVEIIYTSAMLDDAESIQLFSLYAFGKSSPPNEYMEHSVWVVHYAAGLPLALKVLGSFLYGRGMDEWKSTLNRLEAVPEDKINEMLKLSFDGLRETEQKIFLDIACFFKGKRRNYVTEILDSFDFYAGIGISVLIQKSLISVSEGKLCMHDRIQEMGWHIVRKVSEKPGEHSRLWLPKDVCHVLTSKTGTLAVEGIYLYLSSQDKDVNFSTNTFKSTHELRLLYIHSECAYQPPNVHMRPQKSKWTLKKTCCLPSKLQWLTWEGYLLESLPESFQGEKLVGLDMRWSNIIQLWKGRKNLDKLRFINLSCSAKLRSTPDFTGTPNLKWLKLDDCRCLVEVHPSVGDLKQLVFLSLRNCIELKSLPSRIQMESLETLILSRCKNLTRFPEIAENMGRLSKLYLDGTSIEELPKSLGNLTGLALLDLCRCKNLTSLPGTISRLKHLTRLDLSECTRLEKLPKNLMEIQSLEELSLSYSAITELASSIVFLKNLKTLTLSGCKALMPSVLFTQFGSERPLLSSFGFIKKLVASKCCLTEGMIPSDLSSLFSLEVLEIRENPFNYLPNSFGQLPQLKILNVSRCHNLNALPALPSTLSILQADRCPRLTSFLDFTKYDFLWKLCLSNKEGGWENSADLVLQSLLQGHLAANPQFSIVAPGDTILEWFSQQNEGCHASLQLPLNWCNENILGFAVCVVFNNLGYDIKMRFDIIEEKMQHLKVTPPAKEIHIRPGPDGTSQVWLSFMSFDIFKLLFPRLKPDDWTQLRGSLCMEVDHRDWFSEIVKCAIRIVYKDDMKGMATATIKNSAGLLDDSIGRPELEHVLGDDNTDDDEEVASNVESIYKLPTVSKAYWKERGPMGAEIRMSV